MSMFGAAGEMVGGTDVAVGINVGLEIAAAFESLVLPDIGGEADAQPTTATNAHNIAIRRRTLSSCHVRVNSHTAGSELPIFHAGPCAHYATHALR